MKKYLSLLLITAMVLTNYTSVFAETEKDQSIQWKEDLQLHVPVCLVLKDNGHGELVLVSEETTHSNAKKTIEKELDKGNSVFMAEKTDDSEIYFIEDNKYAITVDENVFIATERVEINVDDFYSNIEAFELCQLPQELVDDVAEAIEKNKDNSEFRAAIFTPVDLSKNTMPVRGDITYPSPSYYTKYGVRFRDTFVKYWQEKVQGQVVGSSARSKANAFVKFAISIAGLSGPYSDFVNAFAAGQSALDAFQALYGPVYYGNSLDSIQTTLYYDRLVRTTRRENPIAPGDYSIGGCTTCKVWLDTQYTNQYYSSNGNHYNKDRYINRVLGSENYANAAYTAMTFFPNTTIDPPVTTKFLDGTAVF